MIDRVFNLKPFCNNQSIPDIQITSTVSQQNQRLKIGYLIQGDLSQIALPKSGNSVKRKHNLWQTTCFEFFLAIFHSPQYWEFNLAPTGDWNIYRFTNYRRGMIEARTFNELPLKRVTQKNNSTYQLETEINLRTIISGDTPLEIAVTTVIEDTHHNISYWALIHPGTQPDFHRRDSFITLNI